VVNGGIDTFFHFFSATLIVWMPYKTKEKTIPIPTQGSNITKIIRPTIGFVNPCTFHKYFSYYFKNHLLVSVVVVGHSGMKCHVVLPSG